MPPKIIKIERTGMIKTGTERFVREGRIKLLQIYTNNFSIKEIQNEMRLKRLFYDAVNSFPAAPVRDRSDDLLLSAVRGQRNRQKPGTWHRLHQRLLPFWGFAMWCPSLFTAAEMVALQLPVHLAFPIPDSPAGGLARKQLRLATHTLDAWSSERATATSTNGRLDTGSC